MVIRASAGGIEALTLLGARLPPLSPAGRAPGTVIPRPRCAGRRLTRRAGGA